jgi:hypothetical protein
LGGLSTPLPGGHVSGTEGIDVATFNVPERLYGKTLRLTLEPDGGYTLAGGGFLFGDKFQLQGRVGQMLHAQTPYGVIELLVQRVDGRPGATFNLGYFKSGVSNAAYEACGLKAGKSSFPAMRNSTVRMVLKLAYTRALRLAA